MIFRRRRIRVNVGADVVQVRRIERAPRLRDRHARERFVRENASALFLSTSDRLELSATVVSRDGAVWVAAYDANALDTILHDARARRIRVSSVHPEPALVPAGLPASRLKFGRKPLAWYPSRPETSRRIQIAATMISLAALLSASAAALAAPSIHQNRFVALHAAEMERAQSNAREAGRLRAELSRVSRELADVVAFDAGRGAVGALIARICDALPDSTAVVSLRVDPREGSITAITTDAAGLLVALSQLDGITNVRASGALTAELVAGIRFERVTVRFRRGGGAR